MFYLARAPESAIELELDRLFESSYLTPTAGIGGVAKSTALDFCVDEIPLYPLSGEGEHLWLKIRKVSIDAQTLLERVAERFGMHANDVGCAGLKDKEAVTTQWLSVHVKGDPETLVGPLADGIEVVEATRHANKLKMGHLKGNHFTITLRDVDEARMEDAFETMRMLSAMGVPNYFGPQRFGHGRRTFVQGWRALAQGELTPFLRKNKRMRQLSLNAVQSAMFNRVLHLRISSGHFATPMCGDVLEKHEGGLFRVDASNLAEAAQLLTSGAAVPTGPMMASRMLRATDEVAGIEDRVMAEFGLTAEMFERRRSELRGERRPLAVRLSDVHVEALEPGVIQIGFSLPSGSYATVLLRELMKNEAFNGSASPS